MWTLESSALRILAVAGAAMALVLSAVAHRDVGSIARGEDDTTKVVRRDDSANKAGERHTTVKLDAIDPDGLVAVQRLLALRGYYDGPLDGHVHPEVERALRTFATAEGIEAASEDGSVAATVIDQLGAGNEVAARWGSTAPRAPELTPAECFRVNYTLARRGYRHDGLLPNAIDETTVDSLRKFQRDTGSPVQLGNYVSRRWLYLLGVAAPESCPNIEDTLPAGMPRASSTEKKASLDKGASLDEKASLEKRASLEKNSREKAARAREGEMGGAKMNDSDMGTTTAPVDRRTSDRPGAENLRHDVPRSDKLSSEGNVPSSERIPPATPPATPHPDEKR